MPPPRGHHDQNQGGNVHRPPQPRGSQVLSRAVREDRYSVRGRSQLGGVRGRTGTGAEPRAGGATQRPWPVTDARSHLQEAQDQVTR